MAVSIWCSMAASAPARARLLWTSPSPTGSWSKPGRSLKLRSPIASTKAKGVLRAEQRHHAAGAVIENLFQIPAHGERVGRPTEPAQRKLIAHNVGYACALALSLEAVSVMPHPVRSVELHVFEHIRRLPACYLGSPAQRNSVPSDLVDEFRPGSQGNGTGSHDFKAQPRRREQLEIFRIRKEGEGFIERPGNPDLALQNVGLAHFRIFRSASERIGNCNR